jgi:DNA-binding NtrC family response regulator
VNSLFLLQMKNISSLIDAAIKKFTNVDIPKLNENISTNLEFRLLFPVDLNKPFKEAKKDFLKNYIHDLLILSLGNVSLAAKKASLHRRQLHRIMNDLSIKPDSHRRELLKPSEYMKSNVQDILEETISHISSEEKKLKSVYSNLEDISSVIANNIDASMSYEEALMLFEKEFIGKALKENKYDIQKTADLMDVSERTLYRKISKFNLGIA